MLDFKLTPLKYWNKEEVKCEGLVPFFGNPGRAKELVYMPSKGNAGNKELYDNIERIVDLTGLKKILRFSANTKLNLGDKVEGKPDHVLNKKIDFVKDIIYNEIAMTYLKFVNMLMWIDNFEKIDDTAIVLSEPEKHGKDAAQQEKELALKKKKHKEKIDIRWQESGISFDTALNFCKEITDEMISYFTLMIDLRFDPHILGQKIDNDFDELIKNYKERTGYVQKVKGKIK